MKITLGAQEFNVPPPKGMKSFALQQRILPMAGRVAHVVMELLSTGGVKVTDAGKLLDEDVFKVLPSALPALGEVFARMPDGELERVTRELLGDATFNDVKLFGSPAGDAFDAVMAGRALDTWKLLWCALRVWYPDFFALGGALSVAAKKVSPSAASST